MPPKGYVKVKDFYCKGCELCVDACPQHILQLSPDRINEKGYHPAEMAQPECTGCGICATLCPEAAITVFRYKAQEVSV